MLSIGKQNINTMFPVKLYLIRDLIQAAFKFCLKSIFFTYFSLYSHIKNLLI